MVDKMYLNNIVSGASIRDDNGKRISSTYVPKVDFESYTTVTDEKLENIQNSLSTGGAITELTTEDLNTLQTEGKVYFAKHHNTCTNVPYYGVSGLNFGLEVLKCGDISTEHPNDTPSRVMQRLYCEGKTYTRQLRGTTTLTWTNWALLSKEGVQPVVSLPDIANDTDTQCVIKLSSCASIYKVKISNNNSTFPTFTFNMQYIDYSTYVGYRDAYTFELFIVVEDNTSGGKGVQTSTFPNVSWIDGIIPEMSDNGNYLLVFRTFDLGHTWVGNLQGKWS